MGSFRFGAAVPMVMNCCPQGTGSFSSTGPYFFSPMYTRANGLEEWTVRYPKPGPGSVSVDSALDGVGAAAALGCWAGAETARESVGTSEATIGGGCAGGMTIPGAA